jgi:hypothetical protein
MLLAAPLLLLGLGGVCWELHLNAQTNCGLQPLQSITTANACERGAQESHIASGKLHSSPTITIWSTQGEIPDLASTSHQLVTEVSTFIYPTSGCWLVRNQSAAKVIPELAVGADPVEDAKDTCLAYAALRHRQLLLPLHCQLRVVYAPTSTTFFFPSATNSGETNGGSVFASCPNTNVTGWFSFAQFRHGMQLAELNALGDALTVLQAAEKSAMPWMGHFSSLLYSLGSVSFNLGNFEAATRYFTQAAQSGLTSGLIGQSHVLAHQGFHRAASELLEPVMQTSGAGINGSVNTTTTELQLAWGCRGVYSKSAAEVNRAIELLQLQAAALSSNASAHNTMLAEITGGDLRRRVHFCLGKLLDSVGNSRESLSSAPASGDERVQSHAWAHFVAGNELKRRRFGREVDEEARLEIEQVRTLGSVFDRQIILQSDYDVDGQQLGEGQRGEGQRGEGEHQQEIVPVFIVGMMRSGTTLLAQMLGMHPQVCSLGEDRTLDNIATYFIKRAKQQLLKRERQRQQQHEAAAAAAAAEEEEEEEEEDAATMFPLMGHWIPGIGSTAHGHRARLLSSIDPAMVHLARAATTRLQKHLKNKCGSTATVAVSKMPSDWQHLWLVGSLFPQAKVIRTVRDPRDVAISIYFQDFQERMPWAYSLTDIRAYHAAYDHLMSRWANLLSLLDVLVVEYEKLVSAPESILRKAVQHLQLPWEPKCLEFHRSDHTAHTASNEQVRRPLYSASVGRWRPYALLESSAGRVPP